MEVRTSAELELSDFNFDRYDQQLVKIAKGNQLSKFAIDTIETEYKRIKVIVSNLNLCV